MEEIVSYNREKDVGLKLINILFINESVDYSFNRMINSLVYKMQTITAPKLFVVQPTVRTPKTFSSLI